HGAAAVQALPLPAADTYSRTSAWDGDVGMNAASVTAMGPSFASFAITENSALAGRRAPAHCSRKLCGKEGLNRVGGRGARKAERDRHDARRTDGRRRPTAAPNVEAARLRLIAIAAAPVR